MKQVFLLISFIQATLFLTAQITQGRIVYERKSQLQIRVNDSEFQNMIPPERKDKFELLFSGNRTLWRPTEDESQEPEMHFDNGSGAQIKIIVPGSNDVTYTDLSDYRKVDLKEVLSKQFIVEDSVHRLNWKIGNETKKILGYDCRMATTQRIQPSTRINMDNGEMKKEEVMDTANVVAWFTNGIQIFGGPDTYQGQLPGTILEVDINNGRSHFIALEVSTKVDTKEIKEPKGKKITQQEFTKERDKLFQEMQKNGGGNFNIKVGGGG
jgi:GLPGLI family protein